MNEPDFLLALFVPEIISHGNQLLKEIPSPACRLYVNIPDKAA
jgi:hypothetical protein